MKKVQEAYHKLQQFIYNLDAAILLVIMCIILAQTLGRVVHLSIPWSEEASRYLYVVMIVLGINVGVSQDLMVKIDMIDNILSPAVKRVFDIAREALSLVVSIIFFYSCFPMIRIGAFQKSAAMQIQMNLIYAVVAFGFALAVLSVAFRLVEFIVGNKEGQEQ